MPERPKENCDPKDNGLVQELNAIQTTLEAYKGLYKTLPTNLERADGIKVCKEALTHRLMTRAGGQAFGL